MGDTMNVRYHEYAEALHNFRKVVETYADAKRNLERTAQQIADIEGDPDNNLRDRLSQAAGINERAKCEVAAYSLILLASGALEGSADLLIASLDETRP
ncbi:hypothetical protein [Roseobacter sp. S98]|uniref:hypothetical protein n=1 Tax=Roseobacter algicola (ex Choi et al. 2025) (nom. illeg.) TaxID=3092138 RepID=UPI0035C71CCB